MESSLDISVRCEHGFEGCLSMRSSQVDSTCGMCSDGGLGIGFDEQMTFVYCHC